LKTEERRKKMTSAQVKNSNVGLMELMGRGNSKLPVKSKTQDFQKMMKEKTAKIPLYENDAIF
jgi:hypothetical protein